MVKSIAEKLDIIRERVFCKKMPEVDSPHCKKLLTFLRDNINSISEDSLLRIYGSNPHDAQYSAVYTKNDTLLFGPPLENAEVLKLPQISFTIKEIKER